MEANGGVHLEQWFFTCDNFLEMLLTAATEGGVAGISSEDQDAAIYPAIYRTAPHNKFCLL